jgi:hypothetical protein
LRTQRLTLTADPTGAIQVARASGGVVFEQWESRPGEPPPAPLTIRSDAADTVFNPDNSVDRLTATGSVTIEQAGRFASGSHAVYQGALGQVELTGNPIARLPEGEIYQAEALIWDRLSGQFRARGPFRSRWRQVPGTEAAMAPLRPQQMP